MTMSAKEFIDKYAGTDPKDIELAGTFERMIDANLAKGKNYATYDGQINLGAKIIIIRKYKAAGWEKVIFIDTDLNVFIKLDRQIGDITSK